MLSSTKFLLPAPQSNYLIMESWNHKEVVFVLRVYLFKNITMLWPEELDNYIRVTSSILKNASFGFTTSLSVRESSAVDYVENIKRLLVLAEKTDEEAKKLILLSQADLILKKIWEHKNYFYLVFSDYYTDENTTDLFYTQKVNAFMRQVSNFHFYQELTGADLVWYFSEYYSTNPNNKIYITESNIKKLFDTQTPAAPEIKA